MLAPAQQVVPVGQHEAPCVDDDAWQQVDPALQQKAELLAPGPYAPQHVCDALHVAAPLKCVQHCLPEFFGMHCGNMVPAPQQSSSAVQEAPLDPPQAKQFGAPVVAGGCGAAVVVAAPRQLADEKTNCAGAPFTVVDHVHVVLAPFTTHVAADVCSELSHELRVCIVAANETPSSHVVVPAAGRWNGE
jgi:hypothetical protein